jgi:hypothetical protein
LNCFFAAFHKGTDVVDGGLRYVRMDFQEWYEIFPDAYEVSPTLDRYQKIALFEEALVNCKKAGKLNSDEVILAANEILLGWKDRPNSRFTLWSKFRAANMLNAENICVSWNDVTIKTSATLPKSLTVDEYFIDRIGRINPQEPSGFGFIILECEDRDQRTAVSRMLDALHLVLGFANMYLTFGDISLVAGYKRPDAPLWNGPYQFVFEGEKFLNESQIWFNPDYEKDCWESFPRQMQDIVKAFKSVEFALSALKNHPLKGVFIDAMASFQEGMISRNSSDRMLRYWGALEQLYVESDIKGRSNEKVIERAIFAESEKELARWKLEHISQLRNRYVHSGSSSDDFHHLCQFLKELVSRHINYFLRKGGHFKNHIEFLNFVQLPSAAPELTRMQELIEIKMELVNSLRKNEPENKSAR